MKSVCVVGLGYIGLPTAIIASDAGFNVYGFDTNKEKITCINNGDPVIQEPDLSTRLKKALANKNFVATEHIVHAHYYLICVPTPFLHGYDIPKADLSYVWSAVDQIATVLQKGDVVILESTVPVGTTELMAQRLQEKTGLQEGIDFFAAHCPERVLPGNIFHELSHNTRIIGGVSHAAMEKAKHFYKPFVKNHLYLTNAKTAEMVKLVENSSRDVSIAFANQVASMAYKSGLNPFEVIELANEHPRVNILKPSCGVGGHCIAVDPWFLIEGFAQETQLLHEARKVNDEKPKQIISILTDFAKKWQQRVGRSCNILLLGLTYKPDVDDLRESPALAIAQQLLKEPNCAVQVCEPHVSDQLLMETLGVSSCQLQIGIEQADAIVALVGHRFFKLLDKTLLTEKTIFDFCGLFYQSCQEKNIGDQQEQFFWPQIDAFVKPIIDYAQESR